MRLGALSGLNDPVAGVDHPVLSSFPDFGGNLQAGARLRFSQYI